MTRLEFVILLVEELQLRGQPFEHAALAEWLASMWPHVQEDPDPYRWAGEFLETHRSAADLNPNQ
jgi:hypothetical protein